MYRILIADDEAIIRDGIAAMVDWHSQGFADPLLAANGQRAWEIIEQTVPDIVLTDIRMPQMDGLELARLLSKKYPGIRVVIISGYSDFEYARRAIEYRVLSYLLKPVSGDDILCLLDKAKRILDRSSREPSAFPEAGNSTEKSESIYYKLLYGSVRRPEEYTAIESTLGSRLCSDWFCVVAMEPDVLLPGDSDPHRFNDLLDLARGFLEAKGFPVLRDKDCVVAILHFSQRSAEWDINRIITHFKEYVMTNCIDREGGSMLFSVGIGRLHKGCRCLNESYEQANKALQYRFFKGKGSVIFYDQIIEEVCSKPAYGQSYMESLDKLCAQVSENPGTATVTLVRLCNNLMKAFGSNKQLMIAKCLDIYFKFLDRIRLDRTYIEMPDEMALYDLLSGYNTGRDLMNAFKDVLEEAIAEFTRRNEKKHNPVVERVKRYIRMNYSSELSVGQLARVMRMNPSYLSTIFKDNTDMPLSNYIMSFRLERAKLLLADSDKLIREIAAEVGFKEYRYFCRVFKSNTGMTPQEYRTYLIFEKELSERR